MGKLIALLSLLIALPAGAATYTLTASYAEGDWTPVPGGSLADTIGESVPDVNDYSRAESAYYSTPLVGNLTGPSTQPDSGSTYLLSVVARAQSDNGLLVVDLLQEGVPVATLVPEELTGEWATFSSVLSPAEAAQVATELWTLSVEIVAGNVSYEGPVDVAWVGLTIIEP